MKHLKGFKIFEAEAQSKEEKKDKKVLSKNLVDKSVVDRLKKDLMADKNDLVADLKEEGLLESKNHSRSGRVNESLAIASIIGLTVVICSALGWVKFDDYKTKLKVTKFIAEEAKKTGKTVDELKKDDKFMKTIEAKAKRKGLLGSEWAGGGTGLKIKESVDVELDVEDLAEELGLDVEELKSEVEEVKSEMGIKESKFRGRLLREFDETLFMQMAPVIVAAIGLLGLGLATAGEKLELARLVWKEAGSVKKIPSVIKNKDKMKELKSKVESGRGGDRYRHTLVD